MLKNYTWILLCSLLAGGWAQAAAQPSRIHAAAMAAARRRGVMVLGLLVGGTRSPDECDRTAPAAGSRCTSSLRRTAGAG